MCPWLPNGFALAVALPHLQMQFSNCLLYTFVWMSHRHLRVHIPQTKLTAFPLPSFPITVNGLTIHLLTTVRTVSIISEAFLSFIISNQVTYIPLRISHIKALIPLPKASDLAQVLITFYLATCDTFFVWAAYPLSPLNFLFTHWDILKCTCIK